MLGFFIAATEESMIMELYASPRNVQNLSDCFFYHTMELPGIGVVEGQWDLRGRLDDYLGGVPLVGRRVLDVGSASGFLSFEMEKKAPKLSPSMLIQRIALPDYCSRTAFT